MAFQSGDRKASRAARFLACGNHALAVSRSRLGRVRIVALGGMLPTCLSISLSYRFYIWIGTPIRIAGFRGFVLVRFGCRVATGSFLMRSPYSFVQIFDASNWFAAFFVAAMFTHSANPAYSYLLWVPRMALSTLRRPHQAPHA